MDELAGKCAVVTGATSGIGLGVARALGLAGCRVMINSHEAPEDGEAIRSGLAQETGGEILFHRADLSDGVAAGGLIAAAEAAFGRVDILVNNAGRQHVAPLHEFPPEMWEKIIALNLSAAFYTTRAALKGMMDRGFGRVINIASAHGLVASPFKGAYVAAKHGLVGLTKVTALEAAEAGVTCNAICPGYVRTPLVEDQIADQAKAHGIAREDVIRDVILAPQPSKRFVEIAEVAALALWLAGDAAKSVTGTALPMDGGWTAR